MRVAVENAENERCGEIHEAHSACADYGDVALAGEGWVGGVMFLEYAVGEWEA